jgi:undecaprenyl-diphosphatase
LNKNEKLSAAILPQRRNMEIFEAFLLGLIQGLTEFLPVSSSGHLLLAEKLGIGSPSLFFNLALHTGTLLAAAVYYRKELSEIFRKPFSLQNRYILAATAVTGVIAVFFKIFLGELLEGRYLAAGFFATTLVLFSAELFTDKKKNKKINFKSALVCGLAQGIAVIPGLSRSGTTVSSLLLMDADRKEAADFSFILSMPIIIAGMIAEISGGGAASFTAGDILPLTVGMLTAALSGYLAVKFFIKLISKKSMKPFAVYTLIVGCICLGMYVIPLFK